MQQHDTQQHQLAAEVIGAVRQSVLATLPDAVRADLLLDAVSLDVPARAIVYRGGDRARCGLVVRGLLRQYVVSADGRELTLRYGGPGTLAGAFLVVAGPTPTWVQAITDTTLLMFDVDKVQEAGRRYPEMAWALAVELANTHRELLRAIVASVFGTVRQRVARHLLDLAAAEATVDGRLEARVTQQELADAVGSVREVVARVLRDFRDRRLIEVSSGGIVILDPVRVGQEGNIEPSLD